MIDVTIERLIPLRAVPRHMPPRPSGKRLHISAVYRWAQRGVRGVVLETIRVGGCQYTSYEALQRFVDLLSAGETPPKCLQQATTHRRQKQIEIANRRLHTMLGTSEELPR